MAPCDVVSIDTVVAHPWYTVLAVLLLCVVIEEACKGVALMPFGV